MRGKLKGQLLAMKFNIAHFGIGEYLVEIEGKTLNEIVAEADDLLRQNPSPPDSVLEEMKDLLDALNNLGHIRFCAITLPPEGCVLQPIVINEFLPNPIGKDNAPKPNGEWVELYNKDSADIDVAGWVLYDENNKNELYITPGNTNTGSTIVPAGGFLVVYRDGDSDFALDNKGGDTVRLYDGKIKDGANLIDSHTYTIDAVEDKSFARIPDGSDNWVDPVPTPGEPNFIGDEETVFSPAVPEEGEEGYEESTITAEIATTPEEISTTTTTTEEVATTTEEIATTTEEIATTTTEEISTTTEEIVFSSGETATSAEDILTSEEIVPDEPASETVEIPADNPPADQTVLIEQAPAATEEQIVVVPENNSDESDEVQP